MKVILRCLIHEELAFLESLGLGIATNLVGQLLNPTTEAPVTGISIFELYRIWCLWSNPWSKSMARMDEKKGIVSNFGVGKHVIPALIVLFPLLKLFPLEAGYPVDWNNHVWIINYFGEYFRQHLWFPTTLVTQLSMGSAFPVFYGYLFYPLFSIPSSLLNPQLVLKLAILGLYWMQFTLVRRVVCQNNTPPWFGNAIGAIVVWAIYPLTNLYHRGAIPELFATGFLVCSVCSFFLLIGGNKKEFSRYFIYWVLFSTLTVGTHPITAIYFSFVFLFSFFLIRFENLKESLRLFRQRRALWSLPIAAIVSILPWIYANIRFLGKLSISQNISATGAHNDFDKWSVRFFPLPFDGHINLNEGPMPTMRHLDMQVNMSMLAVVVFLVLWAFIQRDREMGQQSIYPFKKLGACGLFFVFFSWMSVYPNAMKVLPVCLSIVEFVYRFITYLNIIPFMALVVLLETSAQKLGSFLESKTALSFVMFALGVSAAGIFLKLYSVDVASRLRPAYSSLFSNVGIREDARVQQSGFYGDDDYATPKLYEKFTDLGEAYQNKWLEVAPLGPQFGRALSSNVELKEPTWFGTRVLVFPWNKILVDGMPLHDSQIFRYTTQDTFATFRLSEGKHTITYRHEPDKAWTILNVLAKVALFSLIISAVYSAMLPITRSDFGFALWIPLRYLKTK